MKKHSEVSELVVITKTKKLTSYVITITEKSPKKFKRVFVDRMQNYCLDCLEFLICANAIQMKDATKKKERLVAQRCAYEKLKILEYISLIALENKCILKKQYEQISKQLDDCISLLVA